jgi:hypothetical protein
MLSSVARCGGRRGRPGGRAKYHGLDGMWQHTVQTVPFENACSGSYWTVKNVEARRHHFGSQKFAPAFQRFRRQISAAERDHVEGVEMELGPCASMVLQEVERWASVRAVLNDLTVDHGIVRQRF